MFSVCQSFHGLGNTVAPCFNVAPIAKVTVRKGRIGMLGKFHDQTVCEPQLALVQYAKEHRVVPRLDGLSKLCDLLRFRNNEQVSTLRIFLLQCLADRC